MLHGTEADANVKRCMMIYVISQYANVKGSQMHFSKYTEGADMRSNKEF